MIPERRKHAQEDNVDSWLMSYADMITLLLCFFIVFVSVSEPKKDKLSAITEGMAQRFGLVDLTTPYQGLMHSLQTVTEAHRVLKDVSVEMTPTMAWSLSLPPRRFIKKTLPTSIKISCRY